MKTRLEGQGEGRGGLTRRSLLWMGLGLVSGGCGYRSHPGGASPDEERRLFVAAITNETFRAGLQGLVGAAIRRQLQFEGGVRLVEFWKGSEQVLVPLGTGEQVQVAFGRVVEIRLNYSMLGVSPPQEIRLQVSIWAEELPLQVVPQEGWLSLELTEDFVSW